jgi:membrane protease YdiL (CAAX protease family)
LINIKSPQRNHSLGVSCNYKKPFLLRITKAILLTLFLMIIWYIPQLALVGLYKYTNLIGEGFKQHVYAVVILGSVISYLIIFYYYWTPDLKTIFKLKKIDFGLIPYLVLIVAGLGFVNQPLYDFEEIIDYYRHSKIKPYTGSFLGFDSFFIYFRISSLLLAPIFEELFFRKFLFEKLMEKNKVFVAIIISSLCFSAIHFETPGSLISTFIFGVIACLIYLRTKNIWYTITIHFLNNLLSTLYLIYGESFFGWLYGLNYSLMYWALFAFGILMTVLGMKKITTANNTYK